MDYTSFLLFLAEKNLRPRTKQQYQANKEQQKEAYGVKHDGDVSHKKG
jgi:hypothetical protein